MKRGEEVTEFQCYLNELSYDPVGHIGYLVRLDKKPEEVSLANLRHVKKETRFQFQYLEDRNRFSRDLLDDEGTTNNQ